MDGSLSRGSRRFGWLLWREKIGQVPGVFWRRRPPFCTAFRPTRTTSACWRPSSTSMARPFPDSPPCYAAGDVQQQVLSDEGRRRPQFQEAGCGSESQHCTRIEYPVIDYNKVAKAEALEPPCSHVPGCTSKGIKFSDADFLKMLINLIGSGPMRGLGFLKRRCAVTRCHPSCPLSDSSDSEQPVRQPRYYLRCYVNRFCSQLLLLGATSGLLVIVLRLPLA